MEVSGRSVLAKTESGSVRGRLEAERSIAVFSGIPYVAPPIGPKRWRAPSPPEPWSEVLDARKPGPRAFQRRAQTEDFIRLLVAGLGLPPWKRRVMQTGLKLVPLKQSEDCLTVNVRTPVEAVDLPVMVWIHGGDHTDGAGSDISVPDEYAAGFGLCVGHVQLSAWPVRLLGASRVG
jgi:para-nitrobenzyl esterase